MKRIKRFFALLLTLCLVSALLPATALAAPCSNAADCIFEDGHAGACVRGDTAELDEKGVPVSSVGNGWTYQEGSKSFIIEKEWCLTGFTGESSELSADIYTTVSKGAYVSGGTFRGRVYNSGTIIGGNFSGRVNNEKDDDGNVLGVIEGGNFSCDTVENPPTNLKKITLNNRKIKISTSEGGGGDFITYGWVGKGYMVNPNKAGLSLAASLRGLYLRESGEKEPAAPHDVIETTENGGAFTKGLGGFTYSFTMPNHDTVIYAYFNGPDLTVTAPTFAEVNTGYTQPTAQALTIANAGDSDATITSVVVDDDSLFTIGGSGNTVPAYGAITSWTVQPKANLAAGTHTATITVTYDGGEKATAEVSFTVMESFSITITEQPADTTVYEGNITESLSVAAASSSSPTYQWYSCTDTDKANAEAISGATNASFSIPTDLTAGTYYYFCRVSAEGADAVDSNVATVTVEVPPDTIAPTLTAGKVSRTSDTEAAVTFTSNEAGTYYYVVVESGAAAPSIDTSGSGTACDTSEQTILLTDLSADAKDIYIVVRDVAGNVSSPPLKMEIPAYNSVVYVRGIALTLGEYLADGSDTPTTEKPDTGGYAYFAEGNGTPTLTLYGCQIRNDTEFSGSHEAVAGIFSKGDLTIVAEGNPTVTGQYGGGIRVGGNLTLCGTQVKCRASLTASMCMTAI